MSHQALRFQENVLKNPPSNAEFIRVVEQFGRSCTGSVLTQRKGQIIENHGRLLQKVLQSLKKNLNQTCLK